MKSLESRIAALEQKQQSADRAELVVIRAMMAAGDESELYKLRSFDGTQHWERQPDETESAFTDRVEREIKRAPGCIGVLFEE